MSSGFFFGPFIVPHTPTEILNHFRTVLETASDQVERSIAYGWGPAEAHAEFYRARRAIIDYLQLQELI